MRVSVVEVVWRRSCQFFRFPDSDLKIPFLSWPQPVTSGRPSTDLSHRPEKWTERKFIEYYIKTMKS